jgi:dipeptidyl aminopeptidase/acylaminoacyl peptidase
MTSSTRWLGGFLLLLVPCAAPAADRGLTPTGAKTGLIPRKVLFGNPDRTAVYLSPDGKQLSYLAPVNGVMNVWVAPVEKPADARPMTKDDRRGIRSYFWAYTSKHILYLQDQGGDENYHLYAVNLAAGETRDLTPLKKARADVVGVSHKFPSEVLIALNDRDPLYQDLQRVNLITGERRLVQKNTEFSSFVTDDDFHLRLACKFAPDGGTVYLKPDATNGWSELLKVPVTDSMTTRPAGFDKTGQVMYLIHCHDCDTGTLARLDLRTGKQQLVAEDRRADCGSVLLHPTEKTIQATSFNYHRQRWEFKCPLCQADYDRLRKLQPGDITITSRTLDDQRWVVSFLVDDGPVRYYLYDRPTRKARFLFCDRPALEGLPLAKMHPVLIPTRDGLDLVSYLSLPPGSDPDGKGRPQKPVPLVLVVHGGPWDRDRWGFDPTHQFLANRGYAVLSVNYRGSFGFGKKFLNAGRREWGGKMHDDLIDAVDWAIARKIAPADKVGIFGLSYGGYATLVGLSFTPEKFACGVDMVGPSNLVTLLNTIPPYWTSILQMLKDRIGDPSTEEGRKFLSSRSPLTRAGHIKRPLLIAQGANDPRVKQNESDQIVNAMKARKIPVTYVLFPDEGHGFARPVNNLAFHAVAEAFLARHLGGRYEALSTVLDGSTLKVVTGAEGVPGLKDKLAAAKKP